ncbi:MAG: GIN domain-containing protein [Prevotella sp.]
MRTLIFNVLALASIGLMSGSCTVRKADSIETVKKTVKLSDFNSVTVTGSYEVEYVPGPAGKAVLEGPADLVENTQLDIREGQLTVGSRTRDRKTIVVMGHMKPVVVKVSSPRVGSVFVAGSGSFRSAGNMEAGRVLLSVAGSGDVEIPRIDCESIEVTIAGSGEVELGDVYATVADCSVAGSGDIKARLHAVETTGVGVSGSGDVEIAFDNCGRARVAISGSGDVELSGTLNSLEKSVQGSGSVDTGRLQLSR